MGLPPGSVDMGLQPCETQSASLKDFFMELERDKEEQEISVVVGKK